MSSQGTLCHGVLKFENKRSEWATIRHGKYLTSSIPVTTSHGEAKRICTPTLIAELLKNASSATFRGADLVFLAEQLSHEVHSISHLTRQVSNGLPQSLAEHVDTLTSSYLAAQLSSTKSYAAALRHELEQLPIGSFDNLELLRDLSQALCFALDAYVPFSRDDFHLARALAQIIGMAFDASETARARALEMVRHGIKNVSSSFLGQIDLLYQSAHGMVDFKKIEPNVRFAYGTALDLTSSCEVASRPPTEAASLEVNTVELTYTNGLLDRMDFYENYLGCNGIKFVYPQPEILPQEVRQACIRCDSGLVRGVLDGLVRNAVKHGRPTLIEFAIEPCGDHLLLSIADNGKGMGTARVRKIKESQSSMTFSNSGGFGLAAYRKALAEAGCSLDIMSVLGKGTTVTISIPFAHGENIQIAKT
jgi:signal transduction histidine kinase